jgi:hypothetical protein
MTDHLPSKDLTLAEALELVRKHEGWFKEQEVPSVSRTLVRELDRLNALVNKLSIEHAWAVGHARELRTTLTGISTCSTCEACRGAALRALGDPLQTETRAATSRDARSTEDAGRSGPYTIEPHGDGHALYSGRDQMHHGWNLARITEATPETLQLIEQALNARAAQPPGDE